MCNCPEGVSVGTHTNTVTVTAPNGKQICLDKCIADEVQMLWRLGITTIGSCCGHNKTSGVISVIEEDAQKMIDLGYIMYEPEEGKYPYNFYPKSNEDPELFITLFGNEGYHAEVQLFGHLIELRPEGDNSVYPIFAYLDDVFTMCDKFVKTLKIDKSYSVTIII